MNACHPCLRRMRLIETLAPRIEKQRALLDRILALSDLELITLLGGADEARLTSQYAGFRHADSRAMREEARAHELALICAHAEEYPDRLRGLGGLAPAVISVSGGVDRLVRLARRDMVAIVGTRKATTYGLNAAQKMGRELAGAGVVVISGMAFGIDSAAHEGAVQAGGPTIAVLPGPPHRPYPARKARLYQDILSTGVVVGELGPRMGTWRWALQARNRIIAGMAVATVVIEAPRRSGALITARHADRAGRWIGVLPGPVGVAQSVGTNLLLAKAMAGRQVIDPARVKVVRHAQDVLDCVYGDGVVDVPAELRPTPTASEAALLAKIAAGLTNVTMVDASMLADLSALELKGWLARGAGGALTVLGS
jgi:DNA processing protein